MAEHLRIALIAPPWLPVPPPAYGGTEAVVDRLAIGLRRAGSRRPALHDRGQHLSGPHGVGS